MTDSSYRRAAIFAALATVLASSVAALHGPRLAVSLLAGGTWHIMSLGCLTRVLAAWLGPQPSRRRAVGWLLLKLSLYGGAFAMMQWQAVSALGFGLGFTLVLVIVLAVFAVSARRLAGDAVRGQQFSPAR